MVNLFKPLKEKFGRRAKKPVAEQDGDADGPYWGRSEAKDKTEVS